MIPRPAPQYARRFDLRVGRSLVILHIRRRRNIPSCRNGYIILPGDSSRGHIHILYSPYLYRLSRNRRTEDRLMVVMGADSRRRTRQKPRFFMLQAIVVYGNFTARRKVKSRPAAMNRLGAARVTFCPCIVSSITVRFPLFSRILSAQTGMLPDNDDFQATSVL